MVTENGSRTGTEQEGKAWEEKKQKRAGEKEEQTQKTTVGAGRRHVAQNSCRPPDALRGADVDRHTHLGLSSLSLVLSRATRRNTTQRETPGGLCICKEGCLLLAVCQSSC
ncbi:uncharacterized protein LAJ45_02743 [Morchella importuna]|uniref:uncharacterized protein n=1 Tax=Morchella importuna TaxID=1174673 RepID=UPI001E8EBB56|nr:uncharacterized protein LAJ45_02743 [Morchella importuna]KAH8153156.1 hypothetical protein LAJ45_02743 [Morchella importuna]